MGHIAIDRTEDGTVPDGYVEWVDRDLGPLPVNPLVLRSEG
jgi:hypothetical protein